MIDPLPFTNQKYNDSVFKIAIYKLVDQVPGLVSLTLDSIASKLSGSDAKAYFKDLLPLSQNNLINNDITIYYPEKKKVTYYWICKKLIQLLLWKESRPAIDLIEIWENSKISFRAVNENILKVQQMLTDYANHPRSKSEILKFDNSCPVENNSLPSYQSVIDDQNLVGASNVNLTPRIHQNVNSSETKGHSREHLENGSFSENMLSYCFDGSDKLQARKFINYYVFLALKNRWSSEQKMEFFQDYLEKDALEWYLSYNIRSLTSWKDLKNEFIHKYFL